MNDHDNEVPIASRFDLSPLRRPGFWAALALLVLNDHLAKGAGVLSGWLTGKLSDFAFLIVAPLSPARCGPRAGLAAAPPPWRR